MADSLYRHYYGQDWPPIPDGRGGLVPMSKVFAGLTIGKKWRFFKKDQGVEFDVEPWVAMLDAAKALIPEQYFVVSEWTEQHFHDWCMCPKGIVTIGCASCGKSCDTGNLMVLDYIVDPFDTVILLGSTTKEALKSRSWNFVQQYHAAISRNSLGFAIPGKITKAGYALVNVSDDGSPESVGDKAGIQGRALNEDGNLQGAHAKFVRLVVDELATIRNHDAIKTAMTNLRVGALDFKFAALANPESWDDPSCQYIIPEGGTKAVDVDTGFWTSTRGYWVRHHDGLKSPALKSPEAARKFSFLMTQQTIDDNLTECDGNWDAPQMWKMVRGFPMPVNVSAPVVLDRKVGEQNKVTEPPESYGVVVGVGAGIDPAWSDGGDGAIYQRVLVREIGGRMILDFSDGQEKLAIEATKGIPVAQQLIVQVKNIMQDPGSYCAPLSSTAVDASANQGLADDLDMFIGQGAAVCVHVNNSNRASANPIRAIGVGRADTKDRQAERCCDRYGDRGTEAWCVLAEFCKAGQVRGLPAEAFRQLTQRRFMLITKKANGEVMTSGVKFPLRLESKDDFKRRFKKSPDECDACALAALAVKETLGLLPFGWMKPAEAPLVGPAAHATPLPSVDIPDPAAYSADQESGIGGGPAGEEEPEW